MSRLPARVSSDASDRGQEGGEQPRKSGCECMDVCVCVSVRPACVFMDVHMGVCLYTCAQECCVHVGVCTCISVSTCVHMHECACVCTSVHVCSESA